MIADRNSRDGSDLARPGADVVSLDRVSGARAGWSFDVRSRAAVSDRRSDSTFTGRLVGDPDLPAAGVEQYRRLAAILHHRQDEHQSKVVMISSALPGEGKTLTTANLALTLAESYRRRVLLIDADLRRPTLHRIFGVSVRPALNDALEPNAVRRASMVELTGRLMLLPAGEANPDPMGNLTSAAMRDLIVEISEQFDWIFLDTPPVGLLPDAKLLVAMVDAALLVIRAGRSPFELITAAIETLGRERLLGVVLNGLDASALKRGTAYYGYYAGSYGEPATKRRFGASLSRE